MTPTLTVLMDIEARLRVVEGILEGMLAQGRENHGLLRHVRVTTDHALRLARQKEVLLETIGRMTVELRAGCSGVER